MWLGRKSGHKGTIKLGNHRFDSNSAFGTQRYGRYLLVATSGYRSRVGPLRLFLRPQFLLVIATANPDSAKMVFLVLM